MTPAEFEWRQEQAEMAYERGEIGPVAFLRRMSALGFKIEYSRSLMHDLDKLKRSRADNGTI